MKRIRITHLLITALLTLVFSACNDDDNAKPQIYSVWNNARDKESVEITNSFTDTYIRLHGSGFSSLQAIYCNGHACKFNPAVLRDDWVTFPIDKEVPVNEDVKNPEDLNTIRIVTANGTTVYKDFIFRSTAKMPSVTFVSHTMPQVGQPIYIEGTNLGQAVKVAFPYGEEYIDADFTVESTERINVTVPPNADKHSGGSIRVVCGLDTCYSPRDMFFKQGVFMKNAESPAWMTNNTNVAVFNREELAAITGLPHNPDYAVVIPKDGGLMDNVAVSNNHVGFVRLASGTILQTLVDNKVLQEDTPYANWAVQFDMYISPNPWKTGMFSLRFDKNRSGSCAYVYNVCPWKTFDSDAVSFDEGWQTVTIPFKNFKGIGTSGTTTFGDWFGKLPTESIFTFVNNDIDNDGVPHTTLNGFRLCFANFRMVPTNKPATTY